VFTGLGCHVDIGVALLRALTEAVQSRLTLIAGSRDDLSRRDYRIDAAPPRRISRPARSFRSMPSRRTAATFNEDLEFIFERLRAVGVEQIVAVDLTHPYYAIPVVRAVVPGLEGPDYDPEYVPGLRALNARPAP
jgi:YcaO-like protein with predicted kinase domain